MASNLVSWACVALMFTILSAGAPCAAQDAPAFKVVAVDGTQSARRVSARIEARLPEKGLRELALSIAAKLKGDQVALVNFYLPQNELAKDPWAIVRLGAAQAPVSVLGLRAEDEIAFRAEAERDTRDVVGSWLTSPPALAGKLSIIRAQNGRFIAEWHLRGGQKTTDEVTMSRVSRGYRYDVVGGDGAYYLATWNGPLLLGDATRTIAAAEKLVVNKTAVLSSSPRKEAPGLATPLKAPSMAVSAANNGITPVAAASVQAVDPPRSGVRARRNKSASSGKARASVADLMGGSVAR